MNVGSDSALEIIVFGDDNAIPFLHEIQFLQDQLCSNTAQTQTINYNVLNGSISNIQVLCQLSDS